MQMTDISLKRLNKVGRHTDDQTKGLHLWVKPTRQMYWIFRYTLNGKREGISLGAYPEIGLRQARQRALEARLKVNQLVSPMKVKKAFQSTEKMAKCPKFSEFALDYIETDLLPSCRTKVMEQSPLISENSGYETIQIYR